MDGGLEPRVGGGVCATDGRLVGSLPVEEYEEEVSLSVKSETDPDPSLFFAKQVSQFLGSI